MKAIPVLLTVFIILLAPYPVMAQECIQEPVSITGSGDAITGLVPGEAYISVVFDEPLDELLIVGINIDYPYEMLYQGINGFSAIIRTDETNPKYNYLAGGYRCQMIYRILLPMVIH